MYICKVCKAQLLSAYAFKKQCVESYINLLEIYNIECYETSKHHLVQKDYLQILDTFQVILTCGTCYKTFKTLDGLICHKRAHKGDTFKCKTCDKEYTRLNHLERHELSHNRRKAHMCKICNRIINRVEHLKRHLITHLKDKPYTCDKCERGFNWSEDLKSHANKCTGIKVHLCDVCNKCFNREDTLELHRKMHEDKIPVLPTSDNLDNMELHYIEIDMAETSLKVDDSSDEDENDLLDVEIEVRENVSVDLGDHLTDDEEKSTNIKNQEFKLESIFINKADQNDIFLEEDPDNTEEKPAVYTEQSLNEGIANEDDDINDSDSTHSEYLPTRAKKRGRGRPRKLVNKRPRGRPPSVKIKNECTHKEDDDELPCIICEEKNRKVVDGEDNKEIMHICDICNKVFPRISYLRRHIMTHKVDKPYTCNICPKAFNRKDHLNQHMKSHVKGEYECDECNKVFAKTEQLMRHKNCKHSGNERIISEKKFKCNVCEKAFTTEKYREVHMRSHTGEKSFKCRSCDKSFISKSHLTEHMKFHNDNSKKFLCSECGQRFIRNDYLVIHMRRHRGEKPFKCQYCGKGSFLQTRILTNILNFVLCFVGFPRTTDLTVHERYHTGEKTHLCTICGRGFGRAYNLTVHMRTHTGEKPYQCTYCDAAFAQGNDLKAHIRRHTGERFQCELCPETFLMGYLLTQHKRNIHGMFFNAK